MLDLLLQGAELIAVTDDLASEIDAAVPEPLAGFDQRVEPLLLAQSADRENQRRPRRHGVVSAAEVPGIDAVVHALDLGARGDPRQGLTVVLGAGHGEAGRVELAAQVGRVGQVDVLGMGRDRKRHAEPRHQFGDVGRARDEMGVQVLDALALQIVGEPAGTDEIGQSAAPRHRRAQPRQVGQRPVGEQAQVSAQQREGIGGSRFGQIGHRCLHAVDRIVLKLVGRRLHGEDVQLLAEPFESEDLLQNEGFGKLRVDLYQQADGATVGVHFCHVGALLVGIFAGSGANTGLVKGWRLSISEKIASATPSRPFNARVFGLLPSP